MVIRWPSLSVSRLKIPFIIMIELYLELNNRPIECCSISCCKKFELLQISKGVLKTSKSFIWPSHCHRKKRLKNIYNYPKLSLCMDQILSRNTNINNSRQKTLKVKKHSIAAFPILMKSTIPQCH